MGIRFRKSVKICKGVKINFSKSGASLSLGGRGHSLNFGKRGTRSTIGIPGTGISYSTKVGGGKSSRKCTSTHSTVKVPASVSIRMNDKGQIKIEDRFGREITDQTVLRKIKATPQYKIQKDNLEKRRLEKIDEIVRNAEAENERFINIFELSPVVDSLTDFKYRLSDIKIETFLGELDEIPIPTEKTVRIELKKEAKENVSGSIFQVGKLRKQYIEENIQQRLSDAITNWEEEKNSAKEECRKECEKQRSFLSDLIEGENYAVWEIFDDWIESCELPVEININYDWDNKNNTMMLDVDLPEIEDLFVTKMTKTESGNLKEKKKTQAELREEYTRLVFGLAIFISSNAFNTSPAIEKILVSGYTQRKNKNGEITDDYIYSIKFRRNMFEKRDLSKVSPVDFCMSFDIRCNMTSTMLFKTIKPFEDFE